MALTAKVQDTMAHFLIQTYCFFDVKHRYLFVEVHLDDKHYLAFYFPWKRQLPLTLMPQKAYTSLFSFTELIYIVTGSILPLLPELSFVDPLYCFLNQKT